MWVTIWISFKLFVSCVAFTVPAESEYWFIHVLYVCIWATSCKKQALRSSLMSHQKKACLAPANTSFSMTPTIKYLSWRKQGTFLNFRSVQKRLGLAGASQAFFWHENGKVLRTWLFHDSDLLVNGLQKFNCSITKSLIHFPFYM